MFGFVETCFCLCSHLSLSSRRLLGCPPLLGASPLWPEWREESVGPASLSASSFHVAFLQTNCFIYLSQRFSLAFLSRSVLISILPPLYFPPLPGPLSLILSSLPGFSTCPPYSRESERKGSVGYSCGKHFQTCTKLIRHTR